MVRIISTEHQLNSIKTLLSLFPYEHPTPSQVEMMQTILTASTNSKILIHNSTGAGKTIAVLASALARRTKDQKILVFCRTISQLNSFLREWRALLGNDPRQLLLKNKAVPYILPFLGKMKMCRILNNTKGIPISIPQEAISFLCHLLPCNFHPSRTETKPEGERFAPMVNIKLAYSPAPEKYRLMMFDVEKNQCPYYVQRSMLKAVDVVFTTYPYLSEPLFSTLLEAMGTSLDQTIIIVDEAHNLANTIRESVSLKDIEFVESHIGRHPLLKRFKSVMGQLHLLTPEEIAPEFFWSDLEHALDLKDSDADRSLFSFLVSDSTMALKRFLRMRLFSYVVAKPESLTFVRVAPNEWLKKFDAAELFVCMSGTFRPLSLFAKMFGFDHENTILLDFRPSHNDQIFKSFLSYRGLTSKVSKRTPELYHEMAKTILELVPLSPRHSLVVCPSYSFQNDLVSALQSQIEANQLNLEMVIENRDTKLDDLQKYVSKQTPLLIVAISSGKFSEGIQLVKNGKSLLSLLIFAGLPFITPSDDQKFVSKILSSVLQNSQMASNFEQVVPLMQLISQALGRTVRSAVDRGALVLLDKRAELFRGLDRDFVIRRYSNLNSLKTDLAEFFEGYPPLQKVIKNE